MSSSLRLPSHAGVTHDPLLATMLMKNCSSGNLVYTLRNLESLLVLRQGGRKKQRLKFAT